MLCLSLILTMSVKFLNYTTYCCAAAYFGVMLKDQGENRFSKYNIIVLLWSILDTCPPDFTTSQNILNFMHALVPPNKRCSYVIRSDERDAFHGRTIPRVVEKPLSYK